MIVLGLLLLIVAFVALIDMALASHGTISLHIFGWHPGVVGPGVMLVIGAAIGLVLMLGLAAIVSGERRSIRTKHQQRRLLAGKEEENRRLAEQLAAEHTAEGSNDDTVRTVPSTVPTGVVHRQAGDSDGASSDLPDRELADREFADPYPAEPSAAGPLPNMPATRRPPGGKGASKTTSSGKGRKR